MGTYSIRINGNGRTVSSLDPNEPLLYVLRGLGLTATKFGCFNSVLCGMRLMRRRLMVRRGTDHSHRPRHLHPAYAARCRKLGFHTAASLSLPKTAGENHQRTQRATRGHSLFDHDKFL